MFFPWQNKLSKKRFFAPAVPLILLVGIITAFVVGFLLGKQQSNPQLLPNIKNQTVDQINSSDNLVGDLDFQLFWETWNLAKESFYQQPVSDQDLFYGSMKGILTALKDPYSVFFDPEEAKEFNSDLNGTFEGIGAQIDVDKNGQIVVVAPLPGTPAETAGLLTNDKIVAIDGTETTGMSVDEAVSHIRGKKDTEVALTIYRDGLTELLEVVIIRNTIKIDSVKWEINSDGIAVVSIYLFNEDTGSLFTSAINEILTANVKGIVLDLRGNPGGLLDMAIDVASAWTGEQTVVIQKIQDAKQAFVGSADARLIDVPTVILVNGGSASASEIVSGALQDYGLAKLVGTQTFGKGSVQDYRELKGGSAIKITTAEWLTPKERSINHVGIPPDVVVEYSAEDVKADYDPQMEKALEILKGN